MHLRSSAAKFRSHGQKPPEVHSQSIDGNPSAIYNIDSSVLHRSPYSGGAIHESARRLLDGGEGINDADDIIGPPLNWAAMCGQIEMARFLLSKGAKVNAMIGGREATPLWTAAESGHPDMVRFLVSKGADIELGTAERQVPLSAAVNRLDIVTFLLSKGAKVNGDPRFRGETPLSSAALIGNKAVVDLLIAKGADVNLTGKGGDAPIANAARGGCIEIAKTLLEHGAKVNPTVGAPSVEMAVKGEHKDMVIFLISKGANVNAVTYGNTALDMAIDKHHAEIVTILRQHGALTSHELRMRHGRKGRHPNG